MRLATKTSLTRPLTIHVAVLSLSLLPSFVGCDTGSDGRASPDAGLSPSCLEAEEHSDLEWIQENILTPSCAKFSACHMGSAPSAAGLNLEEGMSEQSLVGVPSTLFPDRTLVVAGDPAASYLMVVLGSQEGPLGIGGTMPYNNPLLCAPKRSAIERWISGLTP